MRTVELVRVDEFSVMLRINAGSVLRGKEVHTREVWDMRKPRRMQQACEHEERGNGHSQADHVHRSECGVELRHGEVQPDDEKCWSFIAASSSRLSNRYSTGRDRASQM